VITLTGLTSYGIWSKAKTPRFGILALCCGLSSVAVRILRASQCSAMAGSPLASFCLNSTLSRRSACRNPIPGEVSEDSIRNESRTFSRELPEAFPVGKVGTPRQSRRSSDHQIISRQSGGMREWELENQRAGENGERTSGGKCDGKL